MDIAAVAAALMIHSPNFGIDSAYVNVDAPGHDGRRQKKGYYAGKGGIRTRLGEVKHVVQRPLPNGSHLPLPDRPEKTMLLSIRLRSVEWGAHGRENEKAWKLNGTSSDLPLGGPVRNWLPRQLPPLMVMNGRTCRVEPINSARHGKALYAAYAADREGRLWTYLPWGPYSGPEELCTRIDAVRASGVRPEYALIPLDRRPTDRWISEKGQSADRHRRSAFHCLAPESWWRNERPERGIGRH